MGTPIDARLHTELWTSWASMLRSYAAAHGLSSTKHAVVEVSADKIILRVDSRWLRFTSADVSSSDGSTRPFAIQEDGSVTLDRAAPEEMDMAAERFAREILS